MRASDLAYNTIIDNLLLGKFKCGDIIEEKLLLEILNTSKTPLREALVRLTQEGFIVNQNRRGMSFVNPNISEVNSLLNLRIALIPYLASKLIDHITDEQINKIEDLIRSPYEDVFIHDFKMHSLINSFSNDKYLIETLDRLEKLSIITLRYYTSFQNSIISNEDIFNKNLQLVDILRERKLDSLAEALKEHVPRYVIQFNHK